MTGLPCLQAFPRPPAATPFRLPNALDNSFVWTTLPVSPTRRRSCAENVANFNKTRNFKRGGRGASRAKRNPSRLGWGQKIQQQETDYRNGHPAPTQNVATKSEPLFLPPSVPLSI